MSIFIVNAFCCAPWLQHQRLTVLLSMLAEFSAGRVFLVVVVFLVFAVDAQRSLSLALSHTHNQTEFPRCKLIHLAYGHTYTYAYRHTQVTHIHLAPAHSATKVFLLSSMKNEDELNPKFLPYICSSFYGTQNCFSKLSQRLREHQIK